MLNTSGYMQVVQPCPTCGHCPTCGQHRPVPIPYGGLPTWQSQTTAPAVPMPAYSLTTSNNA